MLARTKAWLTAVIGAENLEFLTHSRNYLSGSVIRGVLLAVAIPVLTQLLTPDEYGILSVFVSLSTLFSIVFTLNLRSGVVRYYLENAADFDAALGANLLFVSLFGFLAMAVALIFSAPLSAWIQVEPAVFQLAVITSVFWGILEIYLSFLRGSKQSKKYSAINVFRSVGVFGVGIVLILLLEEKRYFGKIYAELIFQAAFMIYALVAMIRMAKFSTELKYITYTCRFSVPLIPHALSRYILGYFDRIIIQQLTTSRETGLYSLAYDVGMAMDMVVMATVKAWQPIFFEEYRDGHLEKLNRMVYAYSGYIYFAAAEIILFGADLAMLVVSKRYFGGLRLIPVLVIGHVFVFLYTLFFQYAAYSRKTELISLNTFIAGAANIGLNYWLIPIYGYEAAAFTTTASFALLFLLHYVNARFVLKAHTVRLRLLLPNFGLLLLLGGGYVYAATLGLNPVLFFVGKLVVGLLAGYYFLFRIAKGAKEG